MIISSYAKNNSEANINIAEKTNIDSKGNIGGIGEKRNLVVPEIQGNLRKHFLEVPTEIRKATGIRIFGKRIKSVVFTTDVAIIRNVNADAVIAVYPFTPQPIINQAVITAADIPVFSGVGGGVTSEKNRVLNLALHAEFQGAIGVVVNAPITNDLINLLVKKIDIPVVVTVVSADENIDARVDSGASILNVSASDKTPFVVDKIKSKYPDIPVIATGGPTQQSVMDTVNAGANAITWTPSTSGQLFKTIMAKYRSDLPNKN